MRRTNWRTLAPWLAAVAILALAAGLRFFRLDAQSLWNDEGTAAALAWRDLATIARNASDDIHPPLYYWLLSLWVRLAGDSEFALRSLSALMSVATVGLTMRLARRWFGSGTALLAGLLLAVSPFAVYYAQEARMYAQVTFMGAAAMLALTRALPASEAEPALQPGRLLVYGLAMLATLYAHYYAAALLLAHNLAFVAWLGLRRRPGRWPWRERRWPWRELGRWALTQALILALYAPWLALAWHTIRHWPSISAPFTFGELVLRLAQALPLGITVHTAPWTLAVGAALAALAALGLSRSAEGLAGSRGRWYPVIAVALYAGVPVGLMYAASLQRPMYNPKFLLLATPATCCCWRGASRRWRRRPPLARAQGGPGDAGPGAPGGAGAAGRVAARPLQRPRLCPRRLSWHGGLHRGGRAPRRRTADQRPCADRDGALL